MKALRNSFRIIGQMSRNENITYVVEMAHDNKLLIILQILFERF